MKTTIIEKFGDNQHAFRPLGSSTSALIDIHDSITRFMEDSNSMGIRVTCLDFSKAFDKLQHHRLINHLHDHNIHHGFLTWILSYLKHRVQRVRVNGSFGEPLAVISGVRQGSVLGPYLFAAFISTLRIVDQQHSRLIKYADDLTLVESIPRTGTSASSLDLIIAWCDNNKMLLNRRKCQQMLICRSKRQTLHPHKDIDISNSIKILGITLTSNLTWTVHFDNVLLSAFRRLHILRSLKPIIPKEKLLEVYRGSVLSLLLYASPVFGPLSDSIVSKMEKLTKRAHRIICNPSCSCTALPSITELRKNLACSLLLKCELPTHPLHSFVPQRLPCSKKFRIPVCLTTRRLKSFFPHTCILANQEI